MQRMVSPEPDRIPHQKKGSPEPAETRHCPVCHSMIERTLDDPKNRRLYLVCGNCGFIFVDSRDRLSPRLEKARYLEHNNDLSEEGYRLFLDSFLQGAIIPYVEKGARVLDFGSGPAPVFSWILKRNGYRVDSFDPFFCPDYSWTKRRYNAIVLVEVLEHLSGPVETLNSLIERLHPGGYLCMRSSLHDGDLSRFKAWWYRQDPTHISFFTPGTIEYLSTGLGLEIISISENRDIILQRRVTDS